MPTGRVKFWAEDRGYGFLRPDDGSEEVFVHRTDLSGSLNVLITDQAVTYELAESVGRKGNGKKAVKVDLA